MFFIQMLNSSLVGAALGALYGVLFVRRTTRQLMTNQQISKKYAFLRVYTFLMPYFLVAIILSIFSHFYQINLVGFLIAFLLFFWTIVLKNMRKLSS